jgi:hypothetical protein
LFQVPTKLGMPAPPSHFSQRATTGKSYVNEPTSRQNSISHLSNVPSNLSGNLMIATQIKRFLISAQKQQSRLNACSSGDTKALERLFMEHRVQRGDNPHPVESVKTDRSIESTTLSTDEFLERAVAARQTTIVKLILQIYLTLSLTQSHGVVHAVLKNPDPEILQALCNRDHAFAGFSVDYGMRSFLTDACALPPEQAVPILHVLLDNGSDVDDG